MATTRRERAARLNLITVLVMNWHLFNWQRMIFRFTGLAYYVFLIGYSYRRTMICPLEIMAGTCVYRWPRAFRRMYKGLAGRMMILYFSCAAIVIVKTVVLLGYFGRWIYNLIS